jgi:hypothetical protein
MSGRDKPTGPKRGAQRGQRIEDAKSQILAQHRRGISRPDQREGGPFYLFVPRSPTLLGFNATDNTTSIVLAHPVHG